MSSTRPTMRAVGAVPAYPDIKSYSPIWNELRVWEGDGWQRESLSWKESAYVAANLIGRMEFVITGPEAQKLLSQLSINNVWKWPVGRSKHLVMLSEDGTIANHALAVRDSEQQFRTLAGLPWPLIQAERLGMDVRIEARKIFILQIAGPKSLLVLEAMLEQSLSNVAFLDVVPIQVPGVEGAVELSRIGMAGTLAYEIRGAYDLGPAVYDAVYQAGRRWDIVRLGWRTYAVNHTEGGFPQLNVTFLPSMVFDPAVAGTRMESLSAPLSGSIPADDIRARLRTPQEVNWAWMGKLDHDFIGRDAFEREVAEPRRKTVTLRWDPDDVTDVFASQLKSGEPYKFIEFPVSPQQPAGGHADLVTKGGQAVGVSSAVVYSYYYRELLSQATVDLEEAEIGNTVIVHWGDHGHRIKQIRATVERFPYLDLPRNEDYDVDTAKRS